MQQSITPYKEGALLATKGWLKVANSEDKDVSITGGISDLGLLISTPIALNSIEVSGTRCGVMIRSPCTINSITINEFFGDGVMLCSSDVEIGYLEIRMKKVGIPYTLLHPDAFQFVGLDKNGKPDSSVTLKNIRIKKIVVYTPYVEGLYEGAQGIFAGDCPIENFSVDSFEIRTDVQEHGITINTGINCKIGSGICSAINTDYKVGISFRDRKGMGNGSRNTISRNAVADFIDDGSGAAVIKEVFEMKKGKSTLPVDNAQCGISERFMDGLDAPETENIQELIAWSAKRLGVDRISIKTIIDVETINGSGFLKDGRKKILFERHYYTRILISKGYDVSDANNPEFISLSPYNNKSKNSYDKYGTLDNQWRRFKVAASNDKEAAMMACSVGLGQVMGANWEMLGYKSVQDFWDSCDTSAGQIVAMTLFIEKKNIAKLLANKEISEFKKIYNGTADNDWVAKFLKEYSRNLKASESTLTPTDSRTTKVITGGTTITVGGIAADVILSGEEEEKVVDIVKNGVEVVSSETGLSKDQIAEKAVDIAKQAADAMWTQDIIFYALIAVSVSFLILLYLYLDDNGYLRR